MSSIAILCGGRDHPAFSYDQIVWLTNIAKTFDIQELIVGAAHGADSWGEAWARYDAHIDVTIMPANWKKYDKAAGHKRNRRMLEYMKLQYNNQYTDMILIAFPGRKGTANMIIQVEKENELQQYLSQPERYDPNIDGQHAEIKIIKWPEDKYQYMPKIPSS